MLSDGTKCGGNGGVVLSEGGLSDGADKATHISSRAIAVVTHSSSDLSTER